MTTPSVTTPDVKGTWVDGASRDDVVAILEQQDKGALIGLAFDTELSGARRWFTSFGSCSIEEPRHDLTALNLLEGAS